MASRALSVSVKANTSSFSKGMKRAKRALRNFRRSMLSTMSTAAKFGGALATIGAGAGLSVLVKRAFSAIDATGKLSARLGVATEDLLAFRHAAQLSGATAEGMDKAFEIFVRRLGEVRMGTGEAKDGLEALGLEADVLAMQNPAEAFRAVSDAISKIKNPADRAAAAYKLFGRQGQQLLNMMSMGSEGLNATKKELEDLGGTFSGIDAKKVEIANDEMLRLKQSMTGVAQLLAIELAPFVSELANRLTQMGAAGGGMAAKVQKGFEYVLLGVAKLADWFSILKVAWNGFQVLIQASIAGIIHSVAFLGDAIVKLVEWVGLDLPDGIKDAIEEVRGFGEAFGDAAEENAAEVADAWDTFVNERNYNAAKNAIEDIRNKWQEAADAAVEADKQILDTSALNPRADAARATKKQHDTVKEALSVQFGQVDASSIAFAAVRATQKKTQEVEDKKANTTLESIDQTLKDGALVSTFG